MDSKEPSTDELIEQSESMDRMEELEASEEEQEDRQWLQDQTPQGSKQPESLYGLFRDVIKSKDNRKLGNLDKKELGGLSISAIGNLHLASLGQTFGHPTFANFFAKQADIVLTTTNSKRGWFQELFISQRKTNNRIMSTNPLSEQSNKTPWSIKNVLPGPAQPASPAPTA